MFVKYISRTRKAKLLFSLFKLFTIYLPKCNLKQAAPVHYESGGSHFKSANLCKSAEEFMYCLILLVYPDGDNIISVKKFLLVYFQEKYVGCG